ncbi:MAG: hypothetical protein LBH30_00900 [Prevotellaceae bacterium]|jgi:hypothetical protein|nr:hypothetical protein [Prevotellaceae bacterium]
MSKNIDKLLPEDFGKSFDMEVFHNWKKSVNEHEQTGIISMVMYVIGLAAIIIIGGLIGVGLMFAFMLIAIAISAPKMSKRKRFQRQLGINNRDVVNAIAASKKRQ